MKIAVLSDIHENFHNLLLAIEEAERNDCTQIICLGDLMNAGIAKVLSIAPMPVYLIWGNNDGEKVDIMKTAARPKSQLTVSNNVYDFLNFDGRKIFISHYDNLALPMAESGRYDAVFFGHTHKISTETIGKTIVVNPGEISAQKTGKASLAIYDTQHNQAEIIILKNTISLKSTKVSQFLKANRERLGFRSEQVFLGKEQK